MHSALSFDSPIGPITLESVNGVLTSLMIGEKGADSSAVHPVLTRAKSQLEEYFAGVRNDFDIPVDPAGTAFQEDIWQTLVEVPFGHTLTYAELGEQSGHPGKARAVGGAVGANPIPIIIPCHRIMGASGAVTGYSAGSGIPTKKALLDLEGIGYRD